MARCAILGRRGPALAQPTDRQTWAWGAGAEPRARVLPSLLWGGREGAEQRDEFSPQRALRCRAEEQLHTAPFWRPSGPGAGASLRGLLAVAGWDLSLRREE